MARIAGVDLPRDKRGEVAIQYIYGIGIPSTKKIFADAQIDPNKQVKTWSDDETERIREHLEVRFPHLEVEFHDGGQPLYPYLVGVE